MSIMDCTSFENFRCWKLMERFGDFLCCMEEDPPSFLNLCWSSLLRLYSTCTLPGFCCSLPTRLSKNLGGDWFLKSFSVLCAGRSTFCLSPVFALPLFFGSSAPTKSKKDTGASPTSKSSISVSSCSLLYILLVCLKFLCVDCGTLVYR